MRVYIYIYTSLEDFLLLSINVSLFLMNSWNVIATIDGIETDRSVIVGNHRGMLLQTPLILLSYNHNNNNNIQYPMYDDIYIYIYNRRVGIWSNRS